ncbi:MAG: OmpA family protein [Crocinitomicaceae bacterium]|nr:OmpA family protein [Crocinitomicaceae bacterium]
MKTVLLFFIFSFISATSFSQEKIYTFFFETNASDLQSEQKKRFDQFLDTINSTTHKINDVQTFCDNRGSVEFNGELAINRLIFIKNQLAKKGFTDLSSQSNGETLSGESTMPEDLRKWRKVEIHIENRIEIENSATDNLTNNAVEEPLKSTFDELTISDLKENNFEAVILKIEFFPGTNALLNEYSYYELDRLFLFMKRNENVTAFIRGHVCCGSDLYLSMERAYAVYNSLIQGGISPKRLSFKGFDNTMPLVEETSEENMQKNRRVDVIFSFPEVNVDQAE